MLFRVDIQKFVLEYIIFPSQYETITYNEYTLDYKTVYENYEHYKVENKQELINLIFTILNSGVLESSFICSYDQCIDDLNSYIQDEQRHNLNNFIHPFNAYESIEIEINNLNKVTIIPKKLYSVEDIVQSEALIKQISDEIITEDMTTNDKIKTFHDYIINMTKYDSESLDNVNKELNTPSNKATGPLLHGKALCGGYTDTMSIFLNQLNIENHKLSSENHVWNYVLLDGNWYHLDLTWDDPVNNLNTDLLIHEFFLITDEQLKSLNTGNHDYFPILQP